MEKKVSPEHEQPETTYFHGFLFHGAKKPFRFNSEYTFDDPEVDGSATLGFGFYATDEVEGAADYSLVRQKGELDRVPYVYVLSVDNIKFWDFRGDSANIALPNSVVLEWLKYYDKVLENENENLSFIQKIWKQKQLDYVEFLKQLASSGKDVDLRIVLGTAIGEENRAFGFFVDSGSPPWTVQFRSFVVDQLGYDGLIYIEGSEKDTNQKHSSFVIYNLANVVCSEKFLSREKLDAVENYVQEG
ncbi:MAG: hypothetical protein GW947_00935 [Candidatus Pacebacteria bacterium]|nr:hypothetical protein [Candidatus Paceibacterota bacterium]PIR60115.1 MAG: hypothetical protein COU68_03060 [Candidatus Pacebacteria bacterium CG10_big_fil_rev_8_21_14_0_10_45_6]